MRPLRGGVPRPREEAVRERVNRGYLIYRGQGRTKY